MLRTVPSAFIKLKEKTVNYLQSLKSRVDITDRTFDFMPIYSQDKNKELLDVSLFISAQSSLYYEPRVSSMMSLLFLDNVPMANLSSLSLFTSSAIVGIYRFKIC
jgi:hypothetical protein